MSKPGNTRTQQGDPDAVQTTLASPHLVVRTRCKRIRAEGKTFLKFLFLSTYFILGTLGLGYGIYVGGEPPLEPPPAFFYTAIGVASLWALSVTAAWLLTKDR
jgi:hypothetical protein